MGNQSRLNPFGRENRLPPASVARDQYHRILQVGDQIYVIVPTPIQPYEIVGITEILDPRVQGGEKMLDVTLRSILRFRCMKDVPNPEFVLIAKKSEFGPLLASDKAEPPPADAPQLGEEAELMSAVVQFPSEEKEKES